VEQTRQARCKTPLASSIIDRVTCTNDPHSVDWGRGAGVCWLGDLRYALYFLKPSIGGIWKMTSCHWLKSGGVFLVLELLKGSGLEGF
jgi:hypothetical protein